MNHLLPLVSVILGFTHLQTFSFLQCLCGAHRTAELLLCDFCCQTPRSHVIGIPSLSSLPCLGSLLSAYRGCLRAIWTYASAFYHLVVVFFSPSCSAFLSSLFLLLLSLFRFIFQNRNAALSPAVFLKTENANWFIFAPSQQGRPRLNFQPNEAICAGATLSYLVKVDSVYIKKSPLHGVQQSNIFNSVVVEVNNEMCPDISSMCYRGVLISEHSSYIWLYKKE